MYIEELTSVLSPLSINQSWLHFAGIYHKLFADKSYGLTVETMATNVLPLLIPHTVNPALNFEQYCYLLEVSGQTILVDWE